MMLLFGFLPAGRTDSSLKTAGAGPVSASAHLDFRITILPSLGLSMHSHGLRVQGSGTPLTLQSNAGLAWDGRAPMRSVALRPQRQVIDTSIPAGEFHSAGLVTIAAP
ncbi:MAG: hypothetical protein ABL900_00810 [Burkholderiaceae bacterium]